MLTNNFYKMFLGVPLIGKPTGLILQNGQSGYAVDFPRPTPACPSDPNASTQDIVRFGDGDTPPTRDDYKLSGNVITGFTSTYAKTVSKQDENGFTVTALHTITNNNSNEITIREVGKFSRTQYASGSYTQYLLDRTVLDTPVTIPAGGIGQVEYTITFNYPV